MKPLILLTILIILILALNLFAFNKLTTEEKTEIKKIPETTNSIQKVEVMQNLTRYKDYDYGIMTVEVNLVGFSEK